MCAEDKVDSTRSGKAPLCVLIPTKNEAANIRKCVESVAWADEIYVVDSCSTDKTRQIAEALGCRVVDFVWNRKGPRKKDWALTNLPWKHDWVLIVDADEEVTPALAEEVQEILNRGTSQSGFLVRYVYYFLGSAIKHGDPVWKTVLVRHSCARFEEIAVPEVTAYDVELHEQPRIQGTMARLRFPMVHRDVDNLHHHFHRHNVYSDWEALLRTRYQNRSQENEIRPRLLGNPVERRRFVKRLFLNLPLRPVIYFIYSYFLRGGFLDGRAGFIFNVLKSFYWYQISIKEYELRQSAKSEKARQP